MILSVVVQVKQQFGDNPDVYNKFLDIMKASNFRAARLAMCRPLWCGWMLPEMAWC